MNHQKINHNTKELHRIIGARLRLIRLEKHLSLKQLARRSRVSIHTLDLLECGRGNMQLRDIVRIAMALETPVEHLLMPSSGKAAAQEKQHQKRRNAKDRA